MNEVIAKEDHMCDLACILVKKGSDICETCQVFEFNPQIRSRLKDFALFILMDRSLEEIKELLEIEESKKPEWFVMAYERRNAT